MSMKWQVGQEFERGGARHRVIYAPQKRHENERRNIVQCENMATGVRWGFHMDNIAPPPDSKIVQFQPMAPPVSSTPWHIRYARNIVYVRLAPRVEVPIHQDRLPELIAELQRLQAMAAGDSDKVAA